MDNGIYISAQEPKQLRIITETSNGDPVTVSQVSEDYGADILLVHGDFLVGIQRKKYPSDLAASLKSDDNRLAKQVGLMQSLTMGFFVFEGTPYFDAEGNNAEQETTSWGVHAGRYGWVTQHLVNSVQMSLMAAGFGVMWSENLQDTTRIMHQTYEWLAKGDHSMLELRHAKIEVEGRKTAAKLKRSRMSAAYQVVPGVGIKASKELAKSGNLYTNLDKQDLLSVSGVGSKMADAILEQFGRS